MDPFLAFLLSLVALSVSTTVSESQGVNDVATLSNQLAADIHKKLSTGAGNVFFSPLSISTALAMLFYGTRGRTAEEMRLALGYQNARLTDSEVHSAFQSLMETFSADAAPKDYLFYVANAVLIQKGYLILYEYKNALEEIYKATARDVDFENEGGKAVQEINNWVKLKTNNQISKLLDYISPATIMILLNAVYFKGTWKTKFDPNNTVESVFLNNGLETESVQIPTMHLTEELPYARLEAARVLELPYKGEDIGMVILLPDAMDGLSRLEQELKPNTLKDIRRLTRKTRVHVTLPKFKLEYEKTLNTVLQELGIKNVFESSADLSGITRDGPIVLSKLLHKAVVEVNEEGSEASAVTAAVIKTVSANLGNRFVVDHPFLFAIVDRKTDLILFQGRVSRLQKSMNVEYIL